MENLTLRHNLLTYIAYCLPRLGNSKAGCFFSYDKCRAELESVGNKTTIPTLRKEFSLAKKAGLIDFKTYYKKPYPVLSNRGRLEIKTRLPFKHRGEFDSWKILIFDIPENLRAKRLKLQSELSNLGFGKISRGVYITPHPLFSAVKRMAKKLEIKEFITYLKSQSLEDEKVKIAKAWNLSSLNDDYIHFIVRVHSLMTESHHNPLWPLYTKRLEHEFAKLYGKDPHLPEQFLPFGWQGQRAYGIFKAISNSY